MFEWLCRFSNTTITRYYEYQNEEKKELTQWTLYLYNSVIYRCPEKKTVNKSHTKNNQWKSLGFGNQADLKANQLKPNFEPKI